MQHSFAAGELAPALFARTDLAKYQSAAALLKNFFVDYRGGASTRMGTKYVIQARTSSARVRLIPFQASTAVGYVLEFGDLYIRFIYQGAPVLESTIAITGISKANPAVVTVANTYSVGDIVYITGVAGMTQVNGRYFRVNARTAANITLGDLNGVNIDSTAYSTWTSGGTVARVYTLTSPYAAADLPLLKFAPNVNIMVITHPNYPPKVLTLISAASWTIASISFGATVTAPGGMGIATTGAGGYNYSYVVTAVDINGQESAASSVVASTCGSGGQTFTVSWSAVTGAVNYNVYRAGPSIAGAMPSGTGFGYVMTVTGVSYADSILTNGQPFIEADYSQTPPVAQNPFSGTGVSSITITAGGSYTTVQPTISIAPPGAGTTAQAIPFFNALSVTVFGAGGAGYAVNDQITLTNGTVLLVTAVAATRVTAASVISNPPATSLIPASPIAQQSTSGLGLNASFNVTWTVVSAQITVPGTGYGGAPAVTFSSGAATATSTLGTASAGNPAAPAFFQQRLYLGGPPGALQTIYASKPAAPYNFDISFPIQPDDAITQTLTANQINPIKNIVSIQSGLIIFTSQAAWLVTGGSLGSAVTAIDFVANPQAYNGANDLQPIIAGMDILYVQAKGYVVRNLTYNFYTNVFAGTDISILSSHLFFSYSITGWAWAEEPFKIVWAVRSDGAMLSLTFVKEQELIGWSQHDTNGTFQSVCTITEQITQGIVDAVYVVVQRNVNGNSVQYIERMADRFFNTRTDLGVWCVDAGIQYNGTATTSFIGAEHLAGMTVTGLADGVVITPFTMPTNGFFTLTSAASVVTVGLAFTPQLQTLPIDTGLPTIQGKPKKIPGVTLRVQQTLGLEIGSDFDNTVSMKDLIVGNVSGMLTGQASQTITDLYTGDAFTQLDPTYTIPGQYCIQQSSPYPATILGVIPEITVGDTPNARAG